METYRVVGRRGSHIFYTIRPLTDEGEVISLIRPSRFNFPPTERFC
jgi:hypothetical protein